MRPGAKEPSLLLSGASVLRHLTPTGLLCFGGNLYERDVRDVSATADAVQRDQPLPDNRPVLLERAVHVLLPVGGNLCEWDVSAGGVSLWANSLC